MRHLWIAVTSLVLGLGFTGCSGDDEEDPPPPPPVDSGTNEEDAGTQTDAGIQDAGPPPGTNTFRSDAGASLNNIGSSTLFLNPDGKPSMSLWQNSMGNVTACQGGIPVGSHVAIGTTGATADSFDIATNEAQLSFVSNPDPDAPAFIYASAGEVTHSAVNASNVQGSFSGTTLLDQDDMAVAGAMSGTFNANACPELSRSGTLGDTTGTLAFPINKGLYFTGDPARPGEDPTQIYVMSVDQEAALCSGGTQGPTENTRFLQLSFFPPTLEDQVGTYYSADGGAEMFLGTLTNEGILQPNGSVEAVVEVTSFDGGFLGGTFTATMVGFETDGVGTLSGSFGSTPGCQ